VLEILLIRHIPRLSVRVVILSCVVLGGMWTVGSGGWSILFSPVPCGRTLGFGERNAIVLLSAGSNQSALHLPLVPTLEAMRRIKKAAEEYRACKEARRVCFVIVSGGDPDARGATDADVYRPVLEGLGVNAVDLVLEKRSLNTFENAKYVKPLLRDGRYDTVVLVTSSYHMLRAKLAFNRLGIKVIPAASCADAVVPSLVPRWHNFRMAWRTLREFAGVMQLRMYDWASIY
jgi:uncharacterized SAM-binding protein YcdF (DUF218 family)